jgi:hypothetical protein
MAHTLRLCPYMSELSKPALARMVLVVCSVACSAATSDEPEEDDDDVDLEARIDTSEAALSRQGRWLPPQSAVSGASSARFAYDSPGDRCSGGLRPGARALGSAIEQRFRRSIASPGQGLPAVQGYVCRSVRGGSGLSVHSTGRALDVFIPRIGGRADNTKGDAVANWVLQNAAQLGVQAIIWDRSAWSVRQRRVGYYAGLHPHDDHLHIELTEEAADKRLAWYRGR